MRVLMIGSDLALRANRRVFKELVDFKDLELFAVAPARWRERPRRAVVPFETSSNAGYRIFVGRIIFNGRNGVYFYLSGLARAMRAARPDIIYVWQEPWSICLLETMAMSKILAPSSKIVFRTSQVIDKKYPPPFSWIQSYAFRKADFAVAISEEAKRLLRKKGFDAGIAVLPRAIDPEQYARMDAAGLKEKLKLKGFVIGFVGAFAEQKGIPFLIEAIAGMPADCHGLLVGDGPYKREIEKRIAKHNLGSRVTIVPNVPADQVPRYMSCMDILVLPSITLPLDKERFGRVLLEAMACEVPVVGSSSGEIPNVIGDAGLVFRERDAGDLREKLMALYCNKELMARYARKGKERVLSSFTWKIVAEELHGIFKSLLREQSC